MQGVATIERRARGAAAAFRLCAFALDLPGPLGTAVRAGRKGPEGGEDRSPRLFDGTWMSRQKARPALTNPPMALPSEGAAQGASLFGYFFSGQAEKT